MRNDAEQDSMTTVARGRSVSTMEYSMLYISRTVKRRQCRHKRIANYTSILHFSSTPHTFPSTTINPPLPTQVHNLKHPSAPALTHHASLGCHSTSSTPNSFLTACPRSTFNGTTVAFSSPSPVTFP